LFKEVFLKFFSSFAYAVRREICIFAPELKVDRFVLLATTGKNAKTVSPVLLSCNHSLHAAGSLSFTK
jgi:hypothetical protein